MMKNKTIYEMILEKFELEEGEKFKIISDDYNEKLEKEVFLFDDGYLYDNHGDAISGLLFQDLINGNATVKKLPWKPKLGDRIYYVNSNGYIVYEPFSLTVKHLSLLKCGWIFRTREEAEKNIERVLTEIKEVWE